MFSVLVHIPRYVTKTSTFAENGSDVHLESSFSYRREIKHVNLYTCI